MAFVPQEIIFHHILPKLPVKSICRFKCVSKSFLVLFSDPLFIKTHLSETQRDKILVLSGKLYLIDPEISSNEDSLNLKRLDLPKDHRIYFVGSCNGLCCLSFLHVSKRPVYFFYNPSTRECSKEIPNYSNQYLQPTQWFTREDDWPPAAYGFGYASSIDDYKLLILSGRRYVTHIFSLKNDSLKRIHQYEDNLHGIGTPLNGSLHWLAYSPENIFSIVSFDLVEEKFKSFPPLPDSFQSGLMDLADSCLCILVTESKHEIWQKSVHEIWVMKEYGAADSWTRIFISNEHLQKPIYQSNHLTLRFSLNSGAFFLKGSDGNTVFYYRQIDGDFKKVRVHHRADEEFGYLHVFTESLVSPNCYLSEGVINNS